MTTMQAIGVEKVRRVVEEVCQNDVAKRSRTRLKGEYHSPGVAALARVKAKQYVAPPISQTLSPHMLERIARLRKTERNRRKKLNNRRNRAAR
jgi:hypothetical protein